VTNPSFTELGIAEPLRRALVAEGYTEPTPIQVRAIPVLLAGQDLLGLAQTGTGKTAAFALPLLQQLCVGHEQRRARSVRALILAPTRELAIQIHDSLRTYGRHLHIRTAVIVGGVNINPQTKALRAGVEILVATPGRLLDHQGQGNLNFSQLEILVLDEADRMLDMGFIRDIQKILALLPAKRQTLLFSATFTDEIKQLASKFLRTPATVQITPTNTAAELVRQIVHPVDRERKRALLAHIIQSRKLQQVLVFTRTKHGANRLSEQLDKDGISSMAIHGNKSQPQRIKALEDFKKGAVRVLVATDIAARGLDIDQLPHVVNYELPQVAEDYIHRIGRTGRAGSEGEALSLVCVDEQSLLRDIEKLLRKDLPKDVVSGYAPDPSIPAEPIQTGRQGSGGRGRGPARAPRAASGTAPRGERGRHPSRPGARGK